jgi:hypothetical protein
MHHALDFFCGILGVAMGTYGLLVQYGKVKASPSVRAAVSWRSFSILLILIGGMSLVQFFTGFPD